MYIPKQYKELRVEVMHELIREYPLATLVTLSLDRVEANHIPLYLVEDPPPFGTLQGHVARKNPVWREAVSNREVLVIFHGPNSYITPSWYATKQETGKVVPTWNYAVVHAYGRMKVIHDASWLGAHLEALTDHNEAAYPEPWALSDAPEMYRSRLTGAIVGIEITISRLQGKWKANQNHPARNKEGVVRGLLERGDDQAVSTAALVRDGMSHGR